jgi:hypothetical protein
VAVGFEAALGFFVRVSAFAGINRLARGNTPAQADRARAAHPPIGNTASVRAVVANCVVHAATRDGRGCAGCARPSRRARPMTASLVFPNRPPIVRAGSWRQYWRRTESWRGVHFCCSITAAPRGAARRSTRTHAPDCVCRESRAATRRHPSPARAS